MKSHLTPSPGPCLLLGLQMTPRLPLLISMTRNLVKFAFWIWQMGSGGGLAQAMSLIGLRTVDSWQFAVIPLRLICLPFRWWT